MFTIIWLLFLTSALNRSSAQSGTIDDQKSYYNLTLRTAKIRTSHNDVHICTAVDVRNGTNFVVAFTPLVGSGKNYRLTVSACEERGYGQADDQQAWDCGQIQRSHRQTDLPHAPMCKGTDQPLFSYWPHDESEVNVNHGLIMPPGVGFEMSEASRLRSLVLNVHYGESNDMSEGRVAEIAVGMIAVSAGQPSLKKVRHLSVAGVGFVPAKSVGSVRGSFVMTDAITIHLISTSIHTHEQGKMVLVSKVDAAGHETLLLRINPTTNIHYHMLTNTSLSLGDQLSFSCEYYNDLSYALRVVEKEMCILDLFYYTDDDSALTIRTAYYVDADVADDMPLLFSDTQHIKVFMNQ